jgi:NAD(P)-dependent dehydrogenase (short-subunit alcohol dehydrogenase family)
MPAVLITGAGRGGGIYSYQIAKCAQNMLTACMDQELRSRGIRVFAVHPGIDSKAWERENSMKRRP